VVQSAGMFHAGGNLPAEVTSFVGRRRELADAKRALSKSRLVTLTSIDTFNDGIPLLRHWIRRSCRMPDWWRCG
jgi:hypothetical protein